VNLIKVEVVSVDASDPFNTNVNYRSSPQDTIISSATFTAPGKTETKYNLSGDFYFTYDQDDVPGGGSSTIRLEYGDSGIIDCQVTPHSRTPHEEETLSAYFPAEGVGLRLYNHELTEVYEELTYSVAYSGKTKKIGSSIALMDFGVDYSSIAIWGEQHKYSWDGGGTNWVDMSWASGWIPPNHMAKECTLSPEQWPVTTNLEGIAKCTGLGYDYGGGIAMAIITNAEVDTGM